MSWLTFADKDSTAAPGSTERQLSADNVNAMKAAINLSIQHVTVSLTDAQVKALHTTPIQLIAAAGANTIVMPVHIGSVNKAGTSAYNSVPVRVGYSGLSASASLELYATVAGLNLTSSAFGETNTTTIAPDYSAIVNKALVISANEQISGSSFDVKFTISYYIWDVS